MLRRRLHIECSLRESLYFSQDNWSGRFLHLTRPHKVLPECFDIDMNLNFSPDNRSCVWIFFTSPTQILPAKTDGLVTFALSVNELFKYCKELILPYLLRLFNCVFMSGFFPESWSTGCIVPIYKKGDVDDTNNYRGITLISCLGNYLRLS